MSKVGFFVSRANSLPGYPVLPASAAASVVLATVVGAFGTGEMQLPVRLAFWAALIGVNAVLWQLWFALTVRKNEDWMRAALIGAVLINLPLPLEVRVLLRAVGIEAPSNLTAGWTKALTISAAILLVAVVARQRRPKETSASISPGGLLARAGAVSPNTVLAIRSEDHYCRVTLADGRAPLIHHRFKDALSEVADLDGLQVHRSYWVASAGVVRAVRSGRSWRLVLADGTAVPVSARCVPQARSRGWLARA